MVYVTGDIHGQPRRVVNFAKDVHISRNDVLIILGDVGANYDKNICILNLEFVRF